MCSKLPHNDFVWLTRTDVCEFNPLEYDDKSDYGYVLEVIKKNHAPDFASML